MCVEHIFNGTSLGSSIGYYPLNLLNHFPWKMLECFLIFLKNCGNVPNIACKLSTQSVKHRTVLILVIQSFIHFALIFAVTNLMKVMIQDHVQTKEWWMCVFVNIFWLLYLKKQSERILIVENSENKQAQTCQPRECVIQVM